MLSYVYIQSEGITRGNLGTQQKEVDEEERSGRLSIKSWNLKTQFVRYKNYGWISLVVVCKKTKWKRVESTLRDITSSKKSPFILINKISTPLPFVFPSSLNSLKHITQFKDIFLDWEKLISRVTHQGKSFTTLFFIRLKLTVKIFKLKDFLRKLKRMSPDRLKNS